MSNTTFAVIVGNRGIFPGSLARDGRVLRLNDRLGLRVGGRAALAPGSAPMTGVAW